MDDVDAFLASLDQFTSPTIDAGIHRQQQRQQRRDPTVTDVPHTDITFSTAQQSQAQQPSRSSRRRPREEAAPPPHGTHRGAAGALYPDCDYVSPASSSSSSSVHAVSSPQSPTAFSTSPTATHHDNRHMWWCCRCATENSPQMQSCAICHRRRQRVEGPRPAGLATVVAATAPPTNKDSMTTAVAGGENPRDAFSRETHACVGTTIPKESAVAVPSSDQIACPRCTFFNVSSRRTCEMCDGPLPKPSRTGTTNLQQANDSAVEAVRGAQQSKISPAVNVIQPTSSASASGPLSAAAAAVVPSTALPGLNGSQRVNNARSEPARPRSSRAPPRSFAPPNAPHAESTSNNSLPSAAPADRRVTLQNITRDTFSLSSVQLGSHSNGGDAGSSSESEAESSDDDDDEDDDSTWDDTQAATSQDGAATHLQLVRFLETLQSVRFDDLPFAVAPTSMQAKAELRPFQLQALYWLLSREQQSGQLTRSDSGGDGDFRNTMHRRKEAVDVDSKWDLESNAVPWRGDAMSGEPGLIDPLLHSRSSGDGGQSTMRGAVPPFSSPNDEEERYVNAAKVLRLDDSRSDTQTRDTADNVRGGVFADYMGLGKTRTLIALCEAARAPRIDRVTGSLVESTATLIVCPTSLLTQWVEEIQRCVARPLSAPPLRILIYYGARKRRQTLFQVAQSYDYVLTTYQTVCHERPPQSAINRSVNAHESSRSANALDGHMLYLDDLLDEYNSDADKDEEGAERDMYNVDRHLQTEVGKLFLIRWARIILDEAHYIRNMRTHQSRACLKLSGVCKWAVTATPVQNSLNDLYPLLRFLEVPLFSSLQWWNDEIVRFFNLNPLHPRPMTALNILFRSILLRRTPDAIVDGQPILNLPPKRIVTHTVALSREETQFYRSIHSRATAKLNAMQQRDSLLGGRRTPLTAFTTAFEMLVRCRQTCLHPYIVVAALRRCKHLHSSGAAPVEAANESDSAGASAKLPSAAAQTQQWQQQQHDAEQQRTAKALDQFIQSIVLRRLRSIKSSEFVQSLVAEIKAQRLELRECIICLEAVNRPAILPCAHVFCEECILHALEATRRCPLCKRNSKVSELLLVPVELLDPVQHTPAASPGNGKDGCINTTEAADLPPTVPLDLDLSNAANWGLQLSSKTQYLIDTILGFPAGDKVVVFSTFVTYLRYAQYWLEARGISCAIYSGSLSMKQKKTLLDTFRDASLPTSPRVLLATTSSCGVGINLTCANHCFLMEPSWNPGLEEQALNRVHRIGQAKEVTVTKLVADNTIEQNISQLCERKRALSGYCFGSGGSGGGDGGAGAGAGDGRLRTADLLALFAPESSSSSEEEDSDDEDEEEGEEG